MTSQNDAVLSDRQLAIAKRLAGIDINAARKSGISPRSTQHGPIPLSYAQERIWLHAATTPDAAFYNRLLVAHVHGNLNVSALEHSFLAVIRRHESLRTRFYTLDSTPYQEVSSAINFRLALQEVDFERSGAEGFNWNAEIARIAREETHKHFDLEAGPLIRATLLQPNNPNYAPVLIVNIHHIISDGWSDTVLLREIGAFHNAYLRNTNQLEVVTDLQAGQLASSREPDSLLPDLSIQFGDYVLWQRDRIKSGAIGNHLEYWHKRLMTPLPVLDLPTDLSLTEPISRGARVQFTLDIDVVKALKVISAREGCTLFMTLLAAFKVLLFRYTGQSDIHLVTPVAGRVQVATENLIGCFINGLILRSEICGSATFLATLAQVRSTCLEAYANQEVPYEMMLEHAPLPRGSDHSDLFRVMFQLRNVPKEGADACGLNFERIMPDVGLAIYDLSLEFYEQNGLLYGLLDYDVSAIDSASASRISDHLTTLIAGIVSVPETAVDSLPLIPITELAHIQATGQAHENPASDQMLHDLFIQQVATSPDGIAVDVPPGTGRTARRHTTYAELNLLSDQVAAILKPIVVRDSVVAILLPRNSELLYICQLAALKAGAAHLCLDPVYPDDQIREMLEDSVAVALVSDISGHSRTAEALVASPYVARIDIEAALKERPDADYRFDHTRPEWQTPDSLAYIIYTSGSTGRPKGVMVSHRSIVNLMRSDLVEFALGREDRVAQHSSCAYDSSVEETWLALSSGGTVVVVDDETVRSGPDLVAWLNRERVTCFCPPPTLLRATGCLDPEHDLPLLRLLYVGGEALPVDLADRWSRGRRMVNAYGPTECTVTAIRTDVCAGEAITIGWPVAGLTAWVLNDALEHVPDGIRGCLFLSGVGLAIGYHNRPELAEECFIQHKKLGRLYRTGDVVHRRSDGAFIFHGRKDAQLKLRGYRIELEAIEAAIAECGGVLEAACRVQDIGEEAMLAAYIVPRDPHNPPDIGHIKSALRLRLPPHMVPGLFSILSELPITAGGKLKRESLPNIATLERHSDRPIVPAETDVERLIEAAIRSSLGVKEEISANDDFFRDLGGSSLHAAQVIARLRKDPQTAMLTVHSLFTASTVQELAKVAKQGSRIATEGPVEPIPAAGEWVLSPAQRTLVYACFIHDGRPTYNSPMLLTLQGQVNKAALQSALQAIVNRHEPLRTNYAFVDDELCTTSCQTLSVPLRLERYPDGDEAARSLDAVQRELIDEARTPFNLCSDPLIRTELWSIGDDRHYLLITTHHLIIDGWSQQVLVQELAELYRAADTGVQPMLPDLTTLHRDHALWWKTQIDADKFSSQKAAWSTMMADVPSQLELPLDRPRPMSTTDGSGAHITLSIDPELTESLRDVARTAGATLFMTLMAAWQILLNRYSGQERFAVYTPLAGRTRPELEGLIGYFVNVLPIRAVISADDTVMQVVQRVRQTVLDAMTNQYITAEMLSSAPRMQTMFALQTSSGPDVVFPGLQQVEILRTDTCKCELSLDITENSNGLNGFIEYDSNLFDHNTISRLIANYLQLLNSVADNPGSKASEISLLSRQETQLLDSLNGTTSDLPQMETSNLVALFERQADLSPDSVAVECGVNSITYRVLNARANQVAALLRESGVLPDTHVAICLDRSIEMVVGVLGILKAGGAYLPLDPDHPAERINYVVADARATVVVTSHEILDRLKLNSMTAVCLDRDTQRIAAYDTANVVSNIGPGNLAYMMYTSGSSGQPKGVCVQHGSVVNIVEYMCRELELSARDRLLSVTTLSFDIATLELFIPLTVGGCVVIASWEEARNAVLLRDRLNRSGATIMQATPATWRMLIEGPGLPHGLKAISGGEALPRNIAAAMLEQGCLLWNAYGPTETTIYSTCGQITSAPITIGRPVDNTWVYVLDSCGQRVPVGVPGELHIGGVGVATGYWNRPELTAERFIQCPLRDNASSKMYRTGDSVRMLEDGRIEYLGRNDHQIKIRGIRIEPGEVEVQLGLTESIQQAAVMPDVDPSGDTCLIAFVQIKNGALLKEPELRRSLRDRLPPQYIPSKFITLDSIPLSANGKVDRSRLVEMLHQADNSSQDASEETCDELETHLLTLWRDALGIRNVGIDDDFFDLGGHSLMAIKLLEAIKREFGLSLSLRFILEASTVRKIAERIRSGTQPDVTAAVWLQSKGDRPLLFCAPVHGGSAFQYRVMTSHMGIEQPIVTMEPQGAAGDVAPLNTIEEMAEYSIRTLRSIQPHGPYYICGHSFGGTIGFEMACQLEKQGEEIALLLLIDALILWNTGADQRKDQETRVNPWWRLRYWALSRLDHFNACPGANGKFEYLSVRAKRVLNRLRRVADASERARPVDRGWSPAYSAIVSAERSACEKYKPGKYGGKIHLIVAKSQLLPIEKSPYFRWGQHTSSVLVEEQTPGVHSSILREPRAQTTAELVSKILLDAQKNDTQRKQD